MRLNRATPLFAALLLAACSPTTGETPPASAPTPPPSSAQAVTPLTLEDLDTAGLEAAGFQRNPEVANRSVDLWQTTDCTVQLLVQHVRITGDDRADSEAAFAELPETYSNLTDHPDVALPLAAGGTISSPVRAAELSHDDGSVTPALVAMRVIGERESLVSITEWCWEHPVTAEDFASALAGLSLGGGVTAP